MSDGAGVVLRGTVLTAADPLGLGRVKLQVPQATGTAGLWAAPLLNGSGPLPAPGSIVWVLHESGDPGLPVYLPVEAWGPWTPVPASWVTATGWQAHTAAYRLGPGGLVQFQGEANTPAVTTSTTISNGFQLLTLPATLQPEQSPASLAVVMLPGGASASVAAVARVSGTSVLIYGGPWTYSSGSAYVSLFGLQYATEN
jgi:hypothetical protein